MFAGILATPLNFWQCSVHTTHNAPLTRLKYTTTKQKTLVKSILQNSNSQMFLQNSQENTFDRAHF